LASGIRLHINCKPANEENTFPAAQQRNLIHISCLTYRLGEENKINIKLVKKMLSDKQSCLIDE